MDATLTAIIAILGVGISIASFILGRVKDAEMRGRIYQRLDDMEKNIGKLENEQDMHSTRLLEHDKVNIEVKRDLEHLTELCTKLDNKIDRLLERG